MSFRPDDDHIAAFERRICDLTTSRKQDVLTIGSTNHANSARNCLNLGTVGSGHSATPLQQATLEGELRQFTADD